MNCENCQRHLMTRDDLLSANLDVAAHLASCRACQEWYQRLQRLESNVPLLPVPASKGPEQLKRLILEPVRPAGEGAPAELPALTLGARQIPVPSRWPLAYSALGGMAAALLLIVLGVYLGNLFSRSVHQPEPIAKTQPEVKKVPEDKKTPAKGLANLVLDCDVRLARTSDPRERVNILADLAGVLEGESKNLAVAGGTKELLAMARLYDRVLKEGVVARARDLPMADRRVTLDPIAQRLAQARGAAEKMAAGAEPALAASLRQIAAAAKEGDGRLRQLMDEVTP
jgi:hypothetical protein